jgi:hypothetical protein
VINIIISKKVVNSTISKYSVCLYSKVYCAVFSENIFLKASHDYSVVKYIVSVMRRVWFLSVEKAINLSDVYVSSDDSNTVH